MTDCCSLRISIDKDDDEANVLLFDGAVHGVCVRSIADRTLAVGGNNATGTHYGNNATGTLSDDLYILCVRFTCFP